MMDTVLWGLPTIRRGCRSSEALRGPSHFSLHSGATIHRSCIHICGAVLQFLAHWVGGSAALQEEKLKRPGFFDSQYWWGS